MTARNHRGLLALLCALSAYGALAMDMYLPSMPALGREFGVSPADAQMTMGVFFLGLAFSQSIYGPLADRFGRKLPLCGGLLLFAAGNIGAALAPSFDFLLAMRFFQAIGASAGTVVVRAIIRDLFEERDAAQAYSATMIVFMLVPMLAPMIGSFILLFSGWRAVFWVLFAIATAASIATVLWLPETYPADKRHPAPLSRLFHTYLDLIKDRRFSGYMISAGFTAGVFFTHIAASPHLFIDVFGMSPPGFSAIFAGTACAMIAGTMAFRRLIKRHEIADVLGWAYIVQGGAGILLIAAGASGQFFFILAALVLLVATVGIANPANVSLAMQSQPHRAGAASSLYGTLQFGFAAAISSTIGLFADEGAFAFCVVAGTSGLVAFLANRLLTQPPAPQPV